jgi:two-component system chemotaxis sensor kinase CheA
MILRKLHNRGQRYFPFPGNISLFIIAGYCTYQFLAHDHLLWLGATQAALPYAIYAFRKQTKKDLIRSNRTPLLAAAISGCVWSFFYGLSQGNLLSLPMALSLAALLIQVLDTYAYNHLDRPEAVEELKVGSRFPAMELNDAFGKPQQLERLLQLPSLILFIRGSWCPFCNAQLKEIVGLYKEFDARGIRVIIITPQRQEPTEALAKKYDIPATFLVDSEFKLARRLSIIHRNGVPVFLSRDKYGNDTIFPTAIITNERGEIIWVDQTDDNSIRPEPSTFLKVIDEHKVNYALELKVEQRTAELRDLLDNIGEGFFSFGEELSVDREKSKACDEFFGMDIKYKDPIDLIKPAEPVACKEALELIFSGTVEFDMLKDVLPKDTQVGEKTFALTYRWVPKSKAGNKAKIISIMRDVTLERALAKKITEEEELNNMIVRVAIDRPGFIRVLDEVYELLSKGDRLLSSPDCSKIDVNELFRIFHTVKGGAGMFGLSKVVKAAHQTESLLAPVRDAGKPLSEQERGETVGLAVEVKNALKTQLAQLSSLISEDDLGKKERAYHVTESQLARLSADLLSNLPKDSWDGVRSKLEELRKQPLREALKRLVTLARDLGPKLNKKVEVAVLGDELPVRHDRLEGLFGSLVHLVRNSVDHGIETPEVRREAGKHEAGKLTFSAEKNGRHLTLSIGDDGGGIRPEAVKQVALRKKLITEEALALLSPKQVTELIFMPGFSTKTEVTEFSGRGVGMDAVKAAVEELQGQINVLTETGKGTRFVITLPDVV